MVALRVGDVEAMYFQVGARFDATQRAGYFRQHLTLTTMAGSCRKAFL
jgi:hypothetical protein